MLKKDANRHPYKHMYIHILDGIGAQRPEVERSDVNDVGQGPQNAGGISHSPASSVKIYTRFSHLAKLI